MPEPPPTENWSWDSGVRRRILTDVDEEAGVTTTLLTAPVVELVVPPPPAASVTPEMEKSSSVGEAKCGSEIRLAKSETRLSIVRSAPVG